MPAARHLFPAVAATAALVAAPHAALAQPDRGAPINIVNAFPNLSFSNPVDIVAPDDASNRLYVVEQFPGVISYFDNNPASSTKLTFIDLSDRVAISEEGGIIALAFHPDYATNGHAFISYAVRDQFNTQHTHVSRFTRSAANPDVLDVSSEVLLLDLDTGEENHTMHRLQFGPDGYLYVAVGDGGCCGDFFGNAQNLHTLQGSILRLDVANTSLANPYDIPPTNPFAGNTDGHREEIFCYGLRNPWRFSFDSLGNLWIADVGQDAHEEVSWGSNGANMGWPITEGLSCYPPGSSCNTTGLTLPLFDYPHAFDATSGFSITGGYVYETWNCPALHAKYLFSDFVTGNLWAMSFDDNGATNTQVVAPLTGVHPSCFGRDKQGEVYMADYLSGEIYRFESPSFCAPDLAEPAGVLDFSDVLAFLTAFASANPDADLAPPAFVYDFSDVLAFLIAFGAGCP